MAFMCTNIWMGDLNVYTMGWVLGRREDGKKETSENL